MRGDQPAPARLVPLGGGTAAADPSGDALDRLLRVRRVLPAMGRELAAMRREAARLRLENRRLLTRVYELERDVLADQRRG